MFENLLESKAKKQRTVGQTILSLVLHGLLIFAAVKATQGVAETVKNRPVDTTMVFLKPPPPAPPPPPPPEMVITNPPPKGFQTVVAPTDIPKDIPPIDLKQKAFDPKDFTGKGVEGGVATGVVGGTGPVDVKAQVFTEAELDDPVQPISQPTPRYPPVMQSAGIAGRVELEYIVDTTGHSEPASVKVLKSTHQAFEEPAKEVIQKSVFKPARFRGRPVRQLVHQAVSFKPGQ
ncbi:MAG TPA: TonB family protein [Gemmatimonadales bacterium]|nr:TonB family protein [Gemmatimonadales bacterium]